MRWADATNEMTDRAEFTLLLCRKCESRAVRSTGEEQPARCRSCGHQLVDAGPIAGFVYILSNAGMPGLLKIGLTRRAVEDRVREFDGSTPVPTSFEIEAYFDSSNPEDDERSVHTALVECRVRGKEFFRCEAADAVERIARHLHRPPLYVRANLHRKSKHQRVQASSTPLPGYVRVRCGGCEAYQWVSSGGHNDVHCSACERRLLRRGYSLNA